MSDLPDYLQLAEQFDPPLEGEVGQTFLGEDFAIELETTSRIWIKTGYRQGIIAYLNFFLLTDFIEIHDEASPPRFMSLKSMADSFYRTDLFLRDVTDSGKTGTGGISSPEVRKQLRGIMARHARLSIPLWMMAYFGYQLLEAGENEYPQLDGEDRQRHLNYFSKTYRIMGIPFSADRETMETFARSVEAAHAGRSPGLVKHSRHILALAEMVGVSSDPARIEDRLPPATGAVFRSIASELRSGVIKRLLLRCAGGLFVRKAIGSSARKAVPYSR